MQVPSYISRSVAGSYDNEAVAIFALIFTFYLYVKVRVFPSVAFSLKYLFATLNMYEMILQTLNTGSLFYATLNALSYFYMVFLFPFLYIFVVIGIDHVSKICYCISPFRFVLGEATHSSSILSQCMFSCVS